MRAFKYCFVCIIYGMSHHNLSNQFCKLNYFDLREDLHLLILKKKRMKVNWLISVAIAIGSIPHWAINIGRPFGLSYYIPTIIIHIHYQRI